ncbi:MAG TPA: 4-alpha-glucanotransferase [Gammaproteobacteria bacterium]|nr:4-alpha-glucanotransferase [Gammaproteobacteria bacterium]
MTAPQGVFGARRAGVLAHVTSLPGSGAQGRIVGEARRFVDFLADAGFSVWQTLPLGPVNESGSPYQSDSAFAGNTLLAAEDVQGPQNYEEFRESNRYWLEDFVLYRALRGRHQGAAWFHWSAELRDRNPAALAAARTALEASMETERRAQYRFFCAWQHLKSYANAKGIHIFGDLPLFAAHDSADVWCHRELFCLDDSGRMTETAGAPPDAFAAEGQDWGCPQYHWQACAADGFRWWIERLRVQTERFDLLRIDHFRGLEASWAIPAGAATAREGHWKAVPGDAWFGAVRAALGPYAFVAEDLGYITPEVHALRRRLGLPGMHVLQFAFEGDPHSTHLPHNHEVHGVVYTGTHDNNTTLGWWQALDEASRNRAMQYLDQPADPMPWPLVHAALASVCELAILPLQDCLGLDARARMNTPGTAEGNWRWRCPAEALDPALAQKLRGLLELYDRIV